MLIDNKEAEEQKIVSQCLETWNLLFPLQSLLVTPDKKSAISGVCSCLTLPSYSLWALYQPGFWRLWLFHIHYLIKDSTTWLRRFFFISIWKVWGSERVCPLSAIVTVRIGIESRSAQLSWTRFSYHVILPKPSIEARGRVKPVLRSWMTLCVKQGWEQASLFQEHPPTPTEQWGPNGSYSPGL